MKRLLTRHTELSILSRSATAVATCGRGVAVEMRGGSVSESRLNRQCRGDLSYGSRFNEHVSGKMSFEERVKRRLRRAVNCGSRFNGRVSREMRFKNWIDWCLRVVGCRDRIGDRINVGLRGEVHTNQTITAMASRGRGNNGRRLDP